MEKCKQSIELIANTLQIEGFSRIDAFVHADSGEVCLFSLLLLSCIIVNVLVSQKNYWSLFFVYYYSVMLVSSLVTSKSQIQQTENASIRQDEAANTQ